MDVLEQLTRLGQDEHPSPDAEKTARRRLDTAIAEGHVPSRVRRTGGPRLVAALIAFLAIPAAIAIATNLGGDVRGSYEGFLTGEEGATSPGDPVESDDPSTPKAVRSDAVEEARLLAANGDARLYTYRYKDGAIAFALFFSDGGGMEIGTTRPTPWLEDFDGTPVVSLIVGFSRPGEETLPVAGLSSYDTESVQLRYSSGEPTQVTGLAGGFVIDADLGRVQMRKGILQVDRVPVEVVAYDTDGEELGSAPVCGGPVMELRADPGGDPTPAACHRKDAGKP